MTDSSPSPRIVRTVGWSAFWIAVGVGLTLLTRELHFRPETPFTDQQRPMRFVPEVGYILEPNEEVRWTDGHNFWTISRTNSLGFLDREPISPERAARTCHITILGSNVEAPSVPIADKLQVRLEELALQRLSNLDVTTSAFGLGATGQINQLALYDVYARRLTPKLVVLEFSRDDLVDNSNLLTAVLKGWGPDRMPYFYAERSPDGTIKLTPPVSHPEWNFDKYYEPLESEPSGPAGNQQQYRRRVELLKSVYPQYRDTFGDWQPRDGDSLSVELADEFFVDDPPSAFKDAVDFTAFALDQFKQRAARDGFALLILLPDQLPDFRLNALVTSLATDREIPIVSLDDYMTSRGIAPQGARWPHNRHWNPDGHQWAAEALLEYLEHNPTICTG